MANEFLEIRDSSESSIQQPGWVSPFEKTPDVQKPPVMTEPPTVSETPVVSASATGLPYDFWSDSALHFFLYLASFLSVTFVTSGLGMILYRMIDKAFPDTAVMNAYLGMFSENSIKFGLSFIVVATPVFFAISFLITGLLFQGKIARDSKVRRWTTFIMLYFTFATILSDLISLVFNWFGGDMNARFFLKTFVILILAGYVFGYYLWNIRISGIVGVRFTENKIFGGIAATVILSVFVISFFIIDSPALTRDKKNDTKTTAILSGLTTRIDTEFSKNGTLPSNLTDVNGISSYNSQIRDAKITYKTTSETAYQICADFKSSNLKDDTNTQNSTVGLYGISIGSDMGTDWKHDKGNKCFDKTVSKVVKPISKGNTDSGSISFINPLDSSVSVSNQTQQTRPSGQQSEAQAALSKGSQVYTFHVAYLDFLPMVGKVCRSGGGTLTTGNAGDNMCVGGSKSDLKWPKISECGSNPADTKWTVFDGGNDNWTITLTCKDFNKCDGPGNAICGKDGCKYGGTCQ